MTIWWRYMVLTCEPTSPSTARSFARRVLAEHGETSRTDDVEVVVTELAANACDHAGTPFTVTLSRTEDALLVRVEDGSTQEPVLATRADGRGRGLVLVESLSDAWGVDRATGTKTVWASFTLE